MKKESTDGISFCELLTITFIALKLCDVIDWSWIWVLSPLWIPAVLVLVVILFFTCILVGFKHKISTFFKKRK